jgi:hypothetical protein
MVSRLGGATFRFPLKVGKDNSSKANKAIFPKKNCLVEAKSVIEALTLLSNTHIVISQVIG